MDLIRFSFPAGYGLAGENCLFRWRNSDAAGMIAAK
jgi:hypothetical protein